MAHYNMRRGCLQGYVEILAFTKHLRHNNRDRHTDKSKNQSSMVPGYEVKQKITI